MDFVVVVFFLLFAKCRRGTPDFWDNPGFFSKKPSAGSGPFGPFNNVLS
jgi:hypothetical protein